MCFGYAGVCVLEKRVAMWTFECKERWADSRYVKGCLDMLNGVRISNQTIWIQRIEWFWRGFYINPDAPE